MRHSTKFLAIIFQSSEGHQKQAEDEKLSQPREAKRNMTIQYNVVSWMKFWNGKRQKLRKSKQTIDFNNGSILAH